MYLRRLYAIDAAVMLVLGFAIASWGLMAIPWFGGTPLRPVANTGFWRAAVFTRMFGAALMAFGFAALGVWRTREPRSLAAACPWFFAANGVLFAMCWAQQVAIWETNAGAFLMDIFLVFHAAFGYAWLAGVRDAGAPRVSTTEELRSEWERRIRDAAGQEERNRLARDLHDSIKQQIYAIQTHLAAAQARSDTDPAGAAQSIEHARTSARNAMTEMNAMLDQLRSSPLEAAGLVESLRLQCEALGHRTGAEVIPTFGSIPDNRCFPPGAPAEVFRIAQEALANVARHARAERVTLDFGLDPSADIVLRIRDDGQGFQPDSAVSGMGLRNMQERAAAMHADLEVVSAPGQGCTVTLIIRLRSRVRQAVARQWRLVTGLTLFSLGVAVLIAVAGIPAVYLAPVGILAVLVAMGHGVAIYVMKRHRVA